MSTMVRGWSVDKRVVPKSGVGHSRVYRPHTVVARKKLIPCFPMTDTMHISYWVFFRRSKQLASAAILRLATYMSWVQISKNHSAAIFEAHLIVDLSLLHPISWSYHKGKWQIERMMRWTTSHSLLTDKWVPHFSSAGLDEIWWSLGSFSILPHARLQLPRGATLHFTIHD